MEHTTFLCLPGPGVPYVIPSLLSAEGMKAVVSSVRIGAHTGYPVVYFSDPKPAGTRRVNDWGTDHWKFVDATGEIHWNESVDPEDGYDFDLVPYLQSGKLLWIGKDDRTMTLRSGLTDCPYRELSGERKIQRIQYGKVWTS